MSPQSGETEKAKEYGMLDHKVSREVVPRGDKERAPIAPSDDRTM